jgi:hypothetical protein
MSKIICNTFVKRQTPDSQFSHFAGSWEALEAEAEESLSHGHVTPGFRDGVVLIRVSPDGFFSGVVALTPETQLVATYQARRDGEEAFIDVTARGAKLPAAAVDLVCYRPDVLGADASTIPSDYEIVSINARATGSSDDTEPMHPIAMMRNFLGLAGGTKTEYTAAQFADAIRFWSQHAMRAS